MKNKNKWPDEIIKKVWEKGIIVPWAKPNELRKDLAGALIKWSDYGNTDSELGFGWEIDHRIPESKGGTDELSNLRPYQWLNNRTKGDDYPKWTTAVSSEGDKNVKQYRSWNA